MWETLILLVLVFSISSFIIMRIRRQDRQATRRRQQREPTIKGNKSSTQDDAVAMPTEMDSDDALGLKKDISKDSPPGQQAPRIKTEPMAAAKHKLPECIVLHIMAPSDYPYNGYELLQALLANGLRYGDRHIFHRHVTKTGRGQILFSLASVNKPGTFELTQMGNFSCPGLTVFMLLDDDKDCLTAFDMMLETARQLTEDLGGEVWDEKRQVLNMDKITQIRTRIRQFEKDQRTPDFFPELQPD